MKKINTYIIEKLHLNKDIKVSKKEYKPHLGDTILVLRTVVKDPLHNKNEKVNLLVGKITKFEKLKLKDTFHTIYIKYVFGKGDGLPTLFYRKYDSNYYFAKNGDIMLINKDLGIELINNMIRNNTLNIFNQYTVTEIPENIIDKLNTKY